MKNNKILKILLPIVLVLIIFAVIGKKQGWFGKALTVKVAVENAEKCVPLLKPLQQMAKYNLKKKLKSVPMFPVKLLS